MLAGAGTLVFRIALTYLAVLTTQVMFRSTSATAAFQMMGGMIGLHGVDAIPVPSTFMAMLRHLAPMYGFLAKTHHIIAVPIEDSIPSPAKLAVLFFIVWALPNSQEIMARFSPTLSEVKTNAPGWMLWRPTLRWALTLGLLLAICLMSLQQTKVFLYFQF